MAVAPLLLLGLACSVPAEEPSPTPGPAQPVRTQSPARETPHLRFDDVGASWGVALRHHAGRSDERWMPEVMGGSIALLDVDRNGALDILLVDSGSLSSEGVSPDHGPRLLLGDGRGGFRDATAAYGLTPHGYGMGLAAGDINADGWVDVYLTTFDASDRLLLNDGGQRFVDVTAAWGLQPRGWSTGAAMFDADNDGDLDLYVARYVDYALDDAIGCWFRSVPIYCAPSLYAAQHDRLFRNEGETLVEVSEAAGLAAIASKGLGLSTGDLDEDGDVDLFVAGDLSDNLLLLGDGRGGFTESAIVAGVASSELGRVEASRGVAVANADGQPGWDLTLTQTQREPTNLYLRREHGTYRESADAAGIGAHSRGHASFGVAWLDADNDGDEDLLVANGHTIDNIGTFRDTATFAQRNSLYVRTGPDTLEASSDEGGSALEHVGVSRGLAVGDIDGDGGVDYVVANNDGMVQVARNTTRGRGHWVSLWLEGTSSNRSAIGAVVTLRLGDDTQRREVRGASSYLSVSDRRVHFGLGSAATLEDVAALEVRWPDGGTQTLSLPALDDHYRVVQGSPVQRYVPGEAVLAP